MAEAAKKPEKGAAEAPAASIIIKKVQGGHGGAHGGAWKIALADMMTAMMAFFLLMWLLGATSEAQRKSIADYFKPTPKSRIQMGQLAGSNGILGGRSILDPEGMPSAAFQNSLLDMATPQDTEGGKDRDKGSETDPSPQSESQGSNSGGKGKGDKTGGESDKDGAGQGNAGAGSKGAGNAGEGDKGAGNAGEGAKGAGNVGAGDKGGGAGQGGAGQGDGKGGGPELTEEQKKALADAQDNKNFKDVQQELMRRIAQDKTLAGLKDQVQFVQDKDGLRIEIIDKADFAMFSLGTNRLQPRAQALIEAVAKTVSEMPNKVNVRGHTDSFGFANPDQRNNWILSAERAESTRLLLEKQGVPPDRFSRIEGVADKEPFNAADPYDARNRRISVTLKFQNGEKQ
jgi:chemotaxis protein MotB